MYEVGMKVFDADLESKLSSLLMIDRRDDVGGNYVGIVDEVHKRICINSFDIVILCEECSRVL